MIVCLEGIDGSGKSTQSRWLADRMRARHWKFPDSSTPTGKALYAHLEGHLAMGWRLPFTEEELRAGLGPDRVRAAMDARDRYSAAVPEPDALAFQALQLANRMEHAREIFEAASRGHVVFDRYWPSGYAYGRADGLDGEWLVRLHSWLPQPDLFVLLDLDVEQSGERRPERRDRYEADAAKLRAVAGYYRELWAARAAAAPLRWCVVDARASQDAVARAIEEAVAGLRAAS